MSVLQQVSRMVWLGRSTRAPQSAALPVEIPRGALQLLVLQPSPFCNLDCDYCYLPDRADRSRMPLERLERVLTQIMASGLVGARLSVVWHAGEPMAVPRRWYETAFEIIARHAGAGSVDHHFQTNGVLIDAAWCDFFLKHGVHVGVSVDGPALLHDRHRLTRDGRGTHAAVMQGIATLSAHGIPFHSICVLGRESFAEPDAIYEFFAALGTLEAGFNVEEIEAEHTASSLQADGMAQTVRRFWDRMIERVAAEPGRLRVREIAGALAGLRDPDFGQHSGNAQNLPGRMLSVAHDGRFCFWSPELLGALHPKRGAVSLGNLDTEVVDWSAFAHDPVLRAWQAEIDAGVAACRSECSHWRLCLGGAPSNKLSENGRMDSTTTMACRLGQQVVIDALLAALDRQLPAISCPEGAGVRISANVTAHFGAS